METPMRPNAILDSHSMDFTMRIQHAMRADGQWFRRLQERHPRYGYRWTKWTPVPAPATVAPDSGFTARLPKAA
jgi:hypothetical protein